MRILRSRELVERLFEIGALSSVGIAIGIFIGFLQSSAPFGDDSIYYVGTTESLATNLPFLSWDPHTFAGFVPTIGLSWLTYLPPLLLTRAGMDVRFAFHTSFVGAFLLFGLSVFYFARTVGAAKIVAFAMSILAWSTNAYWNTTIWGGAYNRAFSIPFMFIGLGAAYRFVSRLECGKGDREYWYCLMAWTLLFIGDVFVAIAGSMLILIFLLLSPGKNILAMGSKRIAVLFLPLLGFTAWQVVPIIQQLLIIGPYRIQFVEVNGIETLFFPGPTWTSTLNLLYIPLMGVLTLTCFLMRARVSKSQKAFIVSLMVVGAYWFVMGWIPSLWPFVPRLMATNSSIENLAWIFLMAIPVAFAIIQEQMGRLPRISRKATSVPGFSAITLDFRKLLSLGICLLIIANATLVLPTIRPVDWGSLSGSLNGGLNAIVGPPSSDFRVSLQDRALTRGFQYYQPNRFETGGRVENLDPNPFFNNWYQTDVFYKNDLGSIASNYVDDRPALNVTSSLESPFNFAGEKFWMDWYGVKDVIFYPYSYLYNTLGNYSVRPSLFSVTEQSTGYPASEFVVSSQGPGSILTATNSTVVGFYSLAPLAQQEYRQLISILSKMGLNSRFVIPVYLQSNEEALTTPIDFLVTDSYTYSRNFQLESLPSAIAIIVVPSMDAVQGLATTLTQRPDGGLVTLYSQSFSQILDSRETGAFDFVKSTQMLPLESYNATSLVQSTSYIQSLGTGNWIESFKTPNAYGTLQSDPTGMVLNVTNSDPTHNAQLNIQSILPRSVPLLRDLTINLSVEASSDFELGILYHSSRSCCSNYVAVDRTVKAGPPVQFQLPFAQFHKWGDLSHAFGISQAVSLAVNLQPGQAEVSVRFSNVSLTVPSYNTSSFSRSLSLTDDGVLKLDSRGTTEIILTNVSNSSSSALRLSDNDSSIAVPLASFSGGEPGEDYDKILTTGDLQNTFEILFREYGSRSIHEEWNNNENMAASSIPGRFRGVVWKETYSALWSFSSGSNQTERPLRFYYSGPGMIYIPNPPDSLKASFTHISFESAILFSIPFVTLTFLLIFRKRLFTPGKKSATLVEK